MKIAIVVTDGCQASSIHGMVDLLLAANYALRYYRQQPEKQLSVQLVGLRGREKAYNGLTIGPLTSPRSVRKPGLVIVPGAFESILSPAQVEERLENLAPWSDILGRWHGEGAVVAPACTGNFLVAASGIARGRTLACHWLSEKAARTIFRNERFVASRMLIDHGDLVSCGGAFAMTQLLLYLIQRFCGREVSRATAKLMLVEPSFRVQTRFAAFEPPDNHADSAVARCQKYLESSTNERVDVGTLAGMLGISERQLCRRFRKVTGETPVSYLQKIRVEKAKRLLEQGDKRNKEIIWQVGYEDISSFGKLFKRTTGMTMNEYRARFSIPAEFSSVALE